MNVQKAVSDGVEANAVPLVSSVISSTSSHDDQWEDLSFNDPFPALF